MTGELIDVRIDSGGAPQSFLWRGRLYVVRHVTEHGVLATGDTWRVQASPGVRFGIGWYQLTETPDGWRLIEIVG